MVSTIVWRDTFTDFPTPPDPDEEPRLLFLWGGDIYTGWPVDAVPGTDPLQWQWECTEHAWPLRTHVRYWATMPDTMPPHHASDNWLTCPCTACDELRAGDVGVRRLS